MPHKMQTDAYAALENQVVRFKGTKAAMRRIVKANGKGWSLCLTPQSKIGDRILSHEEYEAKKAGLTLEQWKEQQAKIMEEIRNEDNR